MSSTVSDVGGSNKAQLSKDTATEALKAQTRLSDQQLAHALDQQQDRQRELAGQQAAQQQLAVLQAHQVGGSAEAMNAFDAATPEVKAAANKLSTQVLGQLLQEMRSSQPSASGASGERSDQGPATMSAYMVGGDQESSQNQAIQDAAKVAVYRDIANMLTQMNNQRLIKDALRTAESALKAVIARAKPGEMVRIPNYEFDEKTGKLTQKGTKECTREEAQAELEKCGGYKDSISEASQEDMLYLQHAMEKKGQLENTLSNMMKASSDTQNSLTAALKA